MSRKRLWTMSCNRKKADAHIHFNDIAVSGG